MRIIVTPNDAAAMTALKERFANDVMNFLLQKKKEIRVAFTSDRFEIVLTEFEFVPLSALRQHEQKKLISLGYDFLEKVCIDSNNYKVTLYG